VVWSPLMRGGSLGKSPDPCNELMRTAGRLLVGAADHDPTGRILP
jgi:hypothetical protein